MEFNTENVKQTKKRILVKTILYRMIGITITFIISFWWTKEVTSSILLTLIVEFLQAIVYFIYENFWNKIQWGLRVNDLKL